MGDPYGRDRATVLGNIYERPLFTNGLSPCSGTKGRVVWSFHVVAQKPATSVDTDREINGYLDVDARTDKMACASLPALD